MANKKKCLVPNRKRNSQQKLAQRDICSEAQHSDVFNLRCLKHPLFENLDMATEEEAPFAPVFAPTAEEFKEFGKYIEKIQPLCTGGICKIIPPPEWTKNLSELLNYEELDLTIPHPIQQLVEGNKGIYQLLLLEKPKLTLSQFKKLAEKEVPPKSNKYGHEHDSVEQIFWKNVRFSPPMYGADMLGSLFNDKIEDWNLNHLKGSSAFRR